jgi:transposase-like protein
MKNIKTQKIEKRSFVQLIRTLNDEKSCREFLEETRWQGEPVCPHCGSQDERHYKLKSDGEFKGLYKCRDCRSRFTVTVGTMFEGSHISLQNWFYCIYIFLSHKKGISSVQLAKDIGVTQKTAWFMLHRIRHNFENLFNVRFEKEIQVDETYVGGKNRKRNGIKGTQGRSLKQKTPVVGLVSGGMVQTLVVPNVKGNTLKVIIKELVAKGAIIITDGLSSYQGLSNNYTHEIVLHSEHEYVNQNGFHTNTIEGFWSHLKRGLIGIYHLATPKYLSRYCDEFAFRYNSRHFDDELRFSQFLISAYKRLKYWDLKYTYN